MNEYALPELPFGLGDLKPFLSEKQLKVHYDKHHAGYVRKSNALSEKLSSDPGDASNVKALSFNLGGHILHSLFWANLKKTGSGGQPKAELGQYLNEQFGGFDAFKKAFTSVASTVEGSGWAALSFCPETKKLFLAQIEKHNLNLVAGYPHLLVLDMWEHAFYLDYENRKTQYIDNFWKAVNWDEVNNRLAEHL